MARTKRSAPGRGPMRKPGEIDAQGSATERQLPMRQSKIEARKKMAKEVKPDTPALAKARLEAAEARAQTRAERRARKKAQQEQKAQVKAEQKAASRVTIQSVPQEATQPSMDEATPYQAFSLAPYSGFQSDGPSGGHQAPTNEGRRDLAWADRNMILNQNRPIISFHFLENFQVSDKLVHDLMNRGSRFYDAIEDFRAGSIELKTAANLTNRSLTFMAEICPRLKQVALKGAFRLTDVALAAFLANCPQLEFIEISGTEKQAGNIKHACYDKFSNDASFAQKLRKMVLYNQPISRTSYVQQITQHRGNLEVWCGRTANGGQDVRVFWCGQAIAVARPVSEQGAQSSSTHVNEMHGSSKEVVTISDDSDSNQDNREVIVLSDNDNSMDMDEDVDMEVGGIAEDDTIDETMEDLISKDLFGE
ncbi:hypothetical protein SCAR479_05701 [Seiridium cardinale]|uniref:Uncharacterized protein n=1 Tax=Seiridium cardinale TaxID=138064 RepID=A0ABR2XV10_9PEZI